VEEEEGLLVTPEEIAEVGDYWTDIVQDPGATDEELKMGLCYLTLYNIAIESSKDGLDTSLVNTVDLSFKEH
jgi:hypothetical protein